MNTLFATAFRGKNPGLIGYCLVRIVDADLVQDVRMMPVVDVELDCILGVATLRQRPRVLHMAPNEGVASPSAVRPLSL